MAFKRGSGVLMHLSSLPGRYGIGDLGRSALEFIDFLLAARQRYWQFLPLGPVEPCHAGSPYMSMSAFAGNPLLIDPEQLVAEGLLRPEELENDSFSEYSVDFPAVTAFKNRLLRQAFVNFQGQGKKKEYERFCQEEKWLDDYALFMSLRQEQGGALWSQWPRPLARREPEAVAQARLRLADSIQYYCFEQYLFFRQWSALRRHAQRQGIQLVGDMPIYVSQNSADVWGRQECFRLDATTLESTHVAGVPPDYFSASGQRWGNPLYRWEVGGLPHPALDAWWLERFRQTQRLVDIVRIDHFRAFESYWEIAAREKTAINGRWVKGPGRSFFERLAGAGANLPIIAEDLGIITPAVEKLRDELGFPGMKVLQFAFDSGAENYYLPHNYKDGNCVVYTGTHDNDTTLGWYMSSEVGAASKERALRYANSRDPRQIHWDFIRMALSSVAVMAIIPMQDLLGFGGDCRMNRPGTVGGNRRWRCAPRFLNPEVSSRLADETTFYGR